MEKTIVLCSDGTGNAFEERATNVSTLIRSIDLRRPAPEYRPQMAFYDQGVGTNPALTADTEAYSRSRPEAEMLYVLEAPRLAWWMPRWCAWLAGVTTGYGLDLNVKELVHALARAYAPGDRVYLFGFSRGAFTVRAVAGFLHRCRLPLPGESFDEWFATGFELYANHFPPADDIDRFRQRSRPVAIDFLGLWDTVKSYGGVRPVSWPHLRHNPSVKVVRHALALDEQRAWFQHTTWGHANEKLHGVPLEPDGRYQTQDVEEVWFRGYHSDVGGGMRERESARVALLWMLSEAAHCGLRLNGDGRALFEDEADWHRTIEPHDSFAWYWPVVGLVPRQDLHNDWRPPRRTWTRGARAPRDPRLPELRDGSGPKDVLVHASAIDAVRLPRVRPVRTRPLPPGD